MGSYLPIAFQTCLEPISQDFRLNNNMVAGLMASKCTST